MGKVSVKQAKKEAAAVTYDEDGKAVMPRRTKYVEEQVLNHPHYAELDSGTKVGVMAAVGGFSWCTKANNKWMRQLWEFLYHDKPGHGFTYAAPVADESAKLADAAAASASG
jgi:hypothetical protein